MNPPIPSTVSSSSSHLLSIPPFYIPYRTPPFTLHSSKVDTRRRRLAVVTPLAASPSSSENPLVAVAAPDTSRSCDSGANSDSASDVVRNFYGGINRHDLEGVKDLIAENCVYEDLIFPRPFVGRKDILQFFKKFTNSTSKDLQFVIDDISTEDSFSVGVIWHLEWNGKPFPFSKGCSFYRLEVLNGRRQIIYGRDSVEPAIKPGDSALAAIRSVTWLLQQFPQLAERL